MLSLCKSVQWFSPAYRHCGDEGRGPSERSIRAGNLKAVQAETGPDDHSGRSRVFELHITPLFRV
jgi:hypothetical protein